MKATWTPNALDCAAKHSLSEPEQSAAELFALKRGHGEEYAVTVAEVMAVVGCRKIESGNALSWMLFPAGRIATPTAVIADANMSRLVAAYCALHELELIERGNAITTK